MPLDRRCLTVTEFEGLEFPAYFFKARQSPFARGDKEGTVAGFAPICPWLFVSVWCNVPTTFFSSFFWFFLCGRIEWKVIQPAILDVCTNNVVIRRVVNFHFFLRFQNKCYNLILERSITYSAAP